VRVGIVAQQDNERAVELADALRAAVDAGVWVDERTAAAIGGTGRPIAAFHECDLVVSIGGDGTFLHAARGAGATPIIGVNLGEVGFLNAVSPEDAEAVIADLVAGADGPDAFETRERLRLRAAAAGDAESGSDTASTPAWELPPAVNEVVVQAERRGRGGGATTTVRVDGEPYISAQADGVIVATPTGSTAYNLSEGGPLLAPGTEGLLVTDMCATGTPPSLVAPVDARVTVELDAPGVAIADGATMHELPAGVPVAIERANEPLRMAGPPEKFYTALEKLE
jgi:NAD+ kinase